MDGKIDIQPARIEHEQAIYGLMCELEGTETDRRGFGNVFRENLGDRDVFYLIAMRDGCVTGFSSLHMQRLLHHAALIGEIQEIVVSEKYRGQGIGQMLFEKMRAIAKDAGCTQMEVCCRRERKRSLDFYQKMGMACSHFKLCLPLAEDA